MRALLACTTIVAALFPTAAFAHPGISDASGLAHGFVHPMGGLDHVLAMVAVGVLAAVRGSRALVLIPMAFIGMLVAGFLLGLAQVNVPFVELGIALSIVVIAGAAALRRPVPVRAAMVLVGAFAIFHGYAHGIEMPAGSGAATYALGFVLATALLHAAGMLATLALERVTTRGGKALAQVGAGMLALTGLGLLAGSL